MEIDYKKKCEAYEKLLGVGEYDPVKAAFLVYIKMLNQQTAFLDEFNIKTNVSESDKESPKYKRAMDMFDGLPKAILAVNDMRATLKLSKEDIAIIQGEKPLFSKITTPESIANVLGNTAGQQG